MCFSATASFSAGIVLAGAGVYAIHAVKRPEERPLALIPLIFSIQQITEGAIWLTLNDPAANSWLARIYIIIAWALWPAFIPGAVAAIEPDRQRRGLQVFLAGCGLAIAVWALSNLFQIQPSAHVYQHCLIYPYLVPNDLFTALYGITVTVPCLISSYKMIRWLGLGVLLSAPLAFAISIYGGASVWCFFGALLSGLIIFHVRHDVKSKPLPHIRRK